ncbi:MAG: carbamoyltransferase HypF [Candidatus Methanogranum gryphiswaldense]|nr:MAG: carbamoyltransferase HypF [Candidatus Methanogranum sp. U3.2.1]
MRIIFKGTVQGVGFRPSVYRVATSLGLRGAVWNNGSDVIVDIDDGELFLKNFDINRPPLACIESIEKIDSELDSKYNGFKILDSTSESDSFSIPTDTAICLKCLKEMKGAGRRSSYAFISCPNCGPRFTLLSGLPYDREQTVMRNFPMCPHCSQEFSDPVDRRLHHQTICCPVCGPRYYLVDRYGNPLKGDPIRKFANNLDTGMIGIAKSWGGMHICCILDNIKEIREWYGRKYKPFAIMVRDIESTKRYATLTDNERRELQSPHRPIVLVKKKCTKLTEQISPGLDNIGIFLPYTGMQHLLFEYLQADALIMTSANAPGEPMITSDSEALRLGADMYLLHDQAILNRADDSVLRLYDDNRSFIRKSRGSIPSFLETNFKGSVIAVGAQENLAGAVAKKGRVYPTQYVGNGENIGVLEYLESAIRFNVSLTNCVPQVVAMDLHPGYVNRGLAKTFATEYNAKLIEVQHHWAHAASLIAEKQIDRGVFLTLDGTGHGDDGQAWGGEVLYADLEKYKRLAHLEYIPLLGSEKALYDLRRIRFAIDSMNGVENNSFNESDSAVLEKIMDKSVKTSSMGRILDALAYSLDICKERTYDGEPAMRLEKYIANGELIEGFETNTDNGVIRTAHLFANIKKSQRPADIAYSVVYNIMNELVDNAIRYAESENIDNIGLTGGVSYDEPICRMFSDMVKKKGHEPIFHNSVPNGDGGISTGQAAIALKMVE